MSQEEYPPIALEDAQKLTFNWRTYYAALLNSLKNEQNKKNEIVSAPIAPDDLEVFRGFNIPLKDLKNLVKIAKKYNKDRAKSEKINAVRAYFALGEVTPNGPGPVHVLLLPVAKNKDKVYPKGQDLFEIEEGESAIYDFTTPCPDICDTESPLFRSPK